MSDLVRMERPAKRAPESDFTLEGLPSSINRLMQTLPQRVLDLLKTASAAQDRDRGEKQTLKGVLASLTSRERERFLSYALYYLFDAVELRTWWNAEAGTDALFTQVIPDDVDRKITAVFDTVWANRQEVLGDCVLISEPYYARFVSKRQPLSDQVESLKKRFYQLAQRIHVNKQIRMGRRLVEERVALEEELRQAEGVLKEFNRLYKNADTDLYYRKRHIESRRWQEKKAMESIMQAVRYLDATEFATIMTEAIERHLFYTEVELARGKYGFARRTSPEARERARLVMEGVHEAIERWATEHAHDPIMDASIATPLSKREQKLLRYFISLTDAYRSGVEHNHEKGVLEDTERYMENALFMLGAEEKKKK